MSHKRTLLVVALSFAITTISAQPQSSINGRWDTIFGDPNFGGEGLPGIAMDLAVHPLTGDIYAGGGFLRRLDDASQYLVYWTGTEWRVPGEGLQETSFTLEFDDDGNLYAGGDILRIGADTVNNIAVWDGSDWASLGRGVKGGRVFAIRFDGNTGDIYVGGEFEAVIQTDGTEVASPKIAKWNGVSWEAVGRGGVGLYVDDIAIDPISGDVFVGGRLFSGMLNPDSSKVEVESVARWNGNEWTAVDDGSLNIVNRLQFASDGTLYVAHQADGGLGIWDRASWSTPAGGGFSGSQHVLEALEVTDDRVYAGGIFDQVTQPNGSILRATGVVVLERSTGIWRTLESGITETGLGQVLDFAFLDDDLFVGGRFDAAGGRPSLNFARWTEVPAPYPETRVTFRADYRAAMRKGLLSNLRHDRPSNHHPIVDVVTGADADRYFLFDVDGDSIWSVRVLQPAGTTIDYAFAFDVNGNGYNDGVGGDWIYEGSGPGTRTINLTGAAAQTLPVAAYDNRTLLAVGQDFKYRVTTKFGEGNPGGHRFQSISADADVFIDPAQMTPTSSVSVRWYLKDPGGTPPEGIVTRSKNSYWVIDIAPLAAIYEALVEFDFAPIPGVSSPADLRLLHRIDADSPWSLVAADVDVNDQVLRLSAATDFTGEWTLGSVSADNPLSADPPGLAENPSPSDGNLNGPIRPVFNWSEIPSAATYDLYLWEAAQSQPNQPFRSNLSTPGFQDNADLVFGAEYNWRVVARNINGESEGPVWSFTVGSVPDLVVTTLDVPVDLTSGQVIEAKWTLTNNGDGGTNAPVWFDELFVSESATFDSGNAISIGRFKNVSYLNPGESYSNTQTMMLAEGIQGVQYIHVVTDAADKDGDRLDESDEQNNATSVEVQVTLAPFPDLQVTNVVVPSNVFSGDSVLIQWTVENTGNGRTGATSWFDSIFLSDDDFFDFNFSPRENVVRINERYLKSVEHVGALEPGETYTMSSRVKLPDEVLGTASLFVYADIAGGFKQDQEGRVFEFNVELNNWKGDSLQATLTPPPDLIVTEAQGPEEAKSGEFVDVSWTVKNQGPGDTRATAWADHIYYSTEAAFDSSTVVLLGALRHTGALGVDASYSGTRSVRLPDGIAGNGYFFVMADGNANVFEYTFDDNNLSPASDAVDVTLAPYPDLQITQVAVSPTVAKAGQQVALTYTVLNNGTGPTSRGWIDSVYVAGSPEWDPQAVQPVFGYSNKTNLGAGESASTTIVIRLPATIEGVQYLFVKANARGQLFEHPDEDKNEGRSSAILVDAYPPVDLTMQFSDVPTSATSGESVAIVATVTNIGGGETVARSWFDEFYLSTNDTLNVESDRSLDQLIREGSLGGGLSYVRNLDIDLPEDISGDVFLIAMVDSETDVTEVGKTNNIVVHPLSIALSPPADLRVISIDAPSSVQARQPVTVAWTVENEGTGGTRSKASTGGWYDNVYLSFDRTLDTRDVLLGTRERSAALGDGESYSDSLRVNIPAYASGAYYFVVRTDSRDDVYEHEAEGDNLKFERIDLTLPAPSDLIVSAIDAPPQAVPGEPITVSWTIDNMGDNPAQGLMREAVFVSADESWDVDDPILGVAEREIDLAPGGSLSQTLNVDVGKSFRIAADGEVTEVLPGVEPGEYYVIVRTDIGNTIRETNDSNNAASSTGTVEAAIPELIPGTAESIAFVSGQSRYYRLEVDEGEDVRLTVSSDAAVAANELYVRFNQTPSAGGDADYEAADPFTSNQTLVIPSTQAGTYFVLVQARSVPLEESPENGTVLAELLGFEASAITPEVGGQGQVTTTLEGAGFRADDSVFLRDGQGSLIEGERLDAGSSTEMQIRFQLQQAEVGVYSIVVRRTDGITEAVLEGGFEVREATEPTLTIDELIPDAFRVGGRAEFVYRYTNSGNIDIDYLEVQLQMLDTPDMTVETSDGLWTPSDLFPPPDTVAVIDFVMAPDGVFILPLIARDVPPGGVHQATFITETGSAGAYLFSDLVQALTSDEYLERTVGDLLEDRSFVIDNANDFDAETVQLASDEEAWLKYNLEIFVAAGLFDISVLSTPLPKASLQNADFTAPTGGTETELVGSGSGYFAADEFQRILDGMPKEETPAEICARGPKRAITKSCGNPHKACDCTRNIPTTCFPFFDIPRDEAFQQRCDDSFARCKKIQKDARKTDSSAPVGPTACKCRPRITPCDPNDILGPDGYGDEQWVGLSQTLPYSIRFENDPEKALAPAQVVRVNHPLDAEVDARSFRLHDFGFGPFTFSPPENRAHYQTRLDVVDSLGVFVDVTAGIDILARQAFWVFTSIDPATGDQPRDDPFAGFLPINDDRGSGEGFVSYTVQADEAAITGDVIDAQATIFFDINAPIDTPPISNTIDADYPVSRVTVLPERQDSTVFAIDWSGSDVGAGVGSYSLYVSKGDEPFELYAEGLSETSTLFVGEIGSWFRFFVLAEDLVGNREPLKSDGESGTKVAIEELYDASLPKEFALYANYPNPFNPTTNIEYDLPAPVAVRLTVYNTLGQRVAVLLDEDQAAGRYRMVWNADQYASGVYFYRIQAGTFTKTVKMLLVK